MEEASTGLHAEGSRDWANEMPDALLCSIFDIIITAPTAHPSYLAQKAKNVWRLGSVCKAWRNAVRETSIGVCLPATLSDEACTWVSKMMLRAIEFHDPEHTEPKVLQLLSNPSLLARSSKTIISIIDAPCHKRSWCPSSFPNLIELVVWRSPSSRTSPIFDVRLIKDLANLQYLVLASGFTGIRNFTCWPSSCKRLVWTCPSDAHSSKLSVPAIPPNIGLQWISLRAYAVRIQDLTSILGRISELVIHAMYVFVTLPPMCYPSLTDPSRIPMGSSSASGGGGRMKAWRRWKRDHDWANEGLRALSHMLVTDVGLLMFRLRFSRVLISQPLSGRFKEASWRMLGLHKNDGVDEDPSGNDAEVPPPPSSDDDMGRCSHHCASCGQPYNRVPDYSSSSEGDGDREGKGEGSEGHPHDSDDEYDDLMYDEVTPDQVMTAFRQSIDSYASMLAAQNPGSSMSSGCRAPQRPAMPMPLFSGAGCRRGSSFIAQASLECARESLRLPIDYSKVVPLLESRQNPGQDREVMFTRKHQDPAEPARLRFEQPGGARGSLPLRSALPGLLDSTRPVQALSFAPWPYPSKEAVLGEEPITTLLSRLSQHPEPDVLPGTLPPPSCTHASKRGAASAPLPVHKAGASQSSAGCASASAMSPSSLTSSATVAPPASGPGSSSTCTFPGPTSAQGAPSLELCSHPVSYASDSDVGEEAEAEARLSAAQQGGSSGGGGGSSGTHYAADAAAATTAAAGDGSSISTQEAGKGAHHAADAAAGDGSPPQGSPALGAVRGSQERPAAAGDSTSAAAHASGSAIDQALQPAAWQEQYGQLQQALITHPRFIATSAHTLHKINFLQLPRAFGEASLRALFTPFMVLTKVSLITMEDPATCLPPAILPVSVVKVAFHAGGPNQRFDAKLISNLTELWRLALHGYASLDLSAIPEVRPGLLLKIVETPERQAPLGKPGVDVLMPKGRVVDMSLQIGTDSSVSNIDRMGAPFVTKVDLNAWAPLCKDMNLRSPAGVELHYSEFSPISLFETLQNSTLDQFTVCIATDMHGDIAAVPPSAATVAQRRQEGQRCPPVFAFVSSSGMRTHGVHLAMMVKHGRVGRTWDLEVMDASIVDDEEGLLFFTFFKSDEHASDGNIPVAPPGFAMDNPLGLALANAQLHLANLQVAGQGPEGGAEEALAAATAALAAPELMDLWNQFGGVHGEDQGGDPDLLDELD
uniref:Uncharacterized protein n=1 Tax=Dunaliella tertiolecta TaxID=3047 RepID=A0A7S3R5K3_DUNTE|mmetsp:Transcript_2638/g.6080  ORF Transcript_2638/g.6080 Transcript_2638/m.6080 type:complete len:1213 (+) Transcript_2638:88-3726(+)|eukprot:CAMPEP_0202385744 /NCGR_PEP_ID=MMETSP1127-20130417/62530_1 /ASSEMBLY_ACC=CAM_ASM_000462 /TAXON_ID=3047 /ORGANISM="Dunaliella tertiolecta, Strain CCMP1320" /LENGTH=1212 /DNA_ID=CAMNT_0048986019 /DNA_START=44 /DNA_END=3682 /DNA_ORIENTATION=+